MITRNFCRDEFACRCGCGFKEPHPMLVVGLQRLRDLLGQPIFVTSGCRCDLHNENEGGSLHSFHLPRADFDQYGCAADIVVPDVPLGGVYQVVTSTEAFGNGGIGIYCDAEPRTHLDVRGISGTHARRQWAFIDDVPTTISNAVKTDNLRRGVMT